MDFCDMYEPNQRKERAMELLNMVEMEDDADKLPTAISGGQQQRVAIARALANDPPILVADEPTGNLDSKTADAIFSMFADLVKGGKTIVMVTHDSALARRVSRTVLLADGEIVNEWVARALPTLSHNQMLNVSHQVEPMHFEPGLVIINEGEKNSQFFIVTKGNVEVVLQASGGMDVVVAQMTPGQYVGEIELFRDESAIATVRAGIKGTELIALNRDEFFRLISESESTKDAFHQIVEQRKKENIAARKGYH
jgi:ABC-type multidrug transport system ATPase subunit